MAYKKRLVIVTDKESQFCGRIGYIAGVDGVRYRIAFPCLGDYDGGGVLLPAVWFERFQFRPHSLQIFGSRIDFFDDIR